MKIILVDNNHCQPEDGIFCRTDISELFPIADKTIGLLCKENENLLIFPHSIYEADDKIDSAPIFYIKNTDNDKLVKLCTGNIMGFIGIGNHQIKIKSRFDKGRDDFLLHYMLQKVFSFNLFDLSYNNEQEDVFDFIMFMFPYLLKKALRQGIYREYRTILHNDANVKGVFDTTRHIALNTPFTGKIAYSTREYCHDNSMTQLIRHTIEFMKTKKYGSAVINIDRDTIDCIKDIIRITPSYDRSERNFIISKNLRMKRHPYYTEYHPLQRLCLQILRMEELKYGENDEEICGILFDGAWLWEEYINTLLPKGFTHPENKHRKGGIYIFEDNSGIRYPDFYNKASKIVLDAKYKRLGSYNDVATVDRDDIHQIIVYINALNATHGAFIAPLEKPQTIIPTKKIIGRDSTISILGIEICDTSTSYSEFCNKMKTSEANFISIINSLTSA